MTAASFTIILLLQLIHAAYSDCPASAVELVAEEEPKYLTSPNFPNDYGLEGVRQSCSWLITANATYEDVVIQIRVHNSSLEPATSCWRDAVEVIDGTRFFHKSLKSWCGPTWPSTTMSTTGPNALIKFTTDFKNNHYTGFLLYYWIEKEPLLIVNVQPWTAVNYVLMIISIILLSSLPGSLLGIFLIKNVGPMIVQWQKEKME